jgi:hypothetical protein
MGFDGKRMPTGFLKSKKVMTKICARATSAEIPSRIRKLGTVVAGSSLAARSMANINVTILSRGEKTGQNDLLCLIVLTPF